MAMLVLRIFAQAARLKSGKGDKRKKKDNSQP
jgi:hypothetical protein